MLHFQFLHPKFQMHSLFNVVRASIYGTVIIFTIICLGMAAHFQRVLTSSDLTRFVPGAIFVCSMSMFIIFALALSSFFLGQKNPINTRYELGSLGIVSILWLVLGVCLALSNSQIAEVECFSASDNLTPLSDAASDFSTDQYHAMYRVLMTFSLINAALVIFSFFGLLFLAVRCHLRGDLQMWHGPVTSCAWSIYNAPKHSKTNSSSSSVLPIATVHMGENVYKDKRERRAGSSSRPRRERSQQFQDIYSAPRRPHDRSMRYHGYRRSLQSDTFTEGLTNGNFLDPHKSRAGHYR